MSYERDDKLLEFAVPLASTALDADDLTATGVHGEYVITKSCLVKRLVAAVTAAVAGSTTAPVITFKRRPTLGSAIGEVSLGTITIPDGTAAGKVLYKELTQPVQFKVGEGLAIEVTTAATGGVPAGNAVYDALVIDDPEVPANEANMVASV